MAFGLSLIHIYLAWRGVLGHVLADQAEPGEVDQQVDRHHRLAGARAALDDQYLSLIHI